ncbi:hypothetical protein FJ692_02810 [Pseudomonas fluorescens]|uniref:Uncharacterized protein n=1 Tax=Pseudomonas fluorescens TaxID=294 RepID=A0A2T0IEI0_PSEFL|nr:hypothetical protein C1751_03925 [Pseudomonas fluorescens]PRW77269.1 hypothetical protein C7A12_12080 [Pseudomonas fluorescens]PRW79165.1 hypothetical protein C7A13_11725 [Pseudomonas fluorescens]PRW93716.1 hypothetical protein C7A10_07185 [Pseudomonas fluorescens]TPV60091.1 hypothetical protein FJ692_02810 [Pseudomonas fluorescens]
MRRGISKEGERLCGEGSLLPLGCEAAPLAATELYLKNLVDLVGAAPRPSGSKLPRHSKPASHCATRYRSP